MSHSELSVLLVKFDPRPREQALLNCFEQNNISHSVFVTQDTDLFGLLKAMKSEVAKQQANLVIFIGFTWQVTVWIIFNYLTGNLPFVVRLGGDPIGVPWMRFKNARKNLSQNGASWVGGFIRHAANILAVRIMCKVIVVTEYLAKQARFSNKQVFVLPPVAKIIDDVDVKGSLHHHATANLLCVTNLNYFEKYQGVIDVLTGLQSVTTDKDISLKIVAGGDYLPKLTEFLKTSELGFSVELCGYQADLERYYKQADIFIYYSTLDAWPNVIMEAMSYGLPIVSNYHPSFCEIFEQRQRYFLNDHKQPESLQKDLERLLEDPQFLSMRSKLSLERAEEIHGRLLRSDKLVNWLQKIAAV